MKTEKSTVKRLTVYAMLPGLCWYAYRKLGKSFVGIIINIVMVTALRIAFEISKISKNELVLILALLIFYVPVALISVILVRRWAKQQNL